MVEHLWVRIAELKAEAALEAWEAAHPRLARALRVARYWRIRWLNLLKDFAESERGQRLARRVEDLRAAALHGYLAATRLCGCRPSRRRVSGLSTRQLILELDLRGIPRDDCVERCDLLDELCGEATSSDALCEDARGELELPSPVDKMV